MATLTRQLQDFNGTPWNSLDTIRWSWFDEDEPALLTQPTDQGLAEVTDGGGELTLDLPNSSKTSGQFGFLMLRQNNFELIGAYRIAVD